MESASDDILTMIFKVYVHELKCSPCSLLGVNHRWHILTSTTRSLWTRIDINVQSVRTILDLLFGVDGYGEKKPGVALQDLNLDDGPLRKYMARSVGLGEGVDLPLDITISWTCSTKSTTVEEEKALAETLQVPSPDRSCLLMDFRGTLLSHLLLAFSESPYKPKDKESRPRKSYRRWRSLEMDLSQIKCSCHGFSLVYLALLGESRLQGSPLLKSLVLRNVITGRYPRYALLLEHLALYDSLSKYLPPMRSIRSLCIINSSGRRRVDIPWEECTSLEELTIDKSSNVIPSFDIFPRLSRIEFKSSTDANIMQKLERSFGSSRPLEVLGLHEKSPGIVSQLLEKSPGLHMKTLKVDCSYYNWDLPDGEIGRTQTMYRVPGRLESRKKEHVRETYKLIGDMSARSIVVMPGNEIMEEILTIARSEELREICLNEPSFHDRLWNLYGF